MFILRTFSSFGKKLNFEETLKSISEKLRFWNWRNLTILGRIQTVKTFAVPVLMYRAGLVCMHEDIIMEANIILFNFIWKGKDKVKRSTLISDVEKGGLRAPHLESTIKTQRILCCKNLLTHNKAVGRPFSYIIWDQLEENWS